MPLKKVEMDLKSVERCRGSVFVASSCGSRNASAKTNMDTRRRLISFMVAVRLVGCESGSELYKRQLQLLHKSFHE